MSDRWWEGPMVAVDTETTGTDPETARLVTAAVIGIGSDGVRFRETWLADPGIEIPEEASKVHGITTEQARAEGRPVAEVVAEIMALVWNAWGEKIPVVAMNATYDLIVIDRELRRNDLPSLIRRAPGPVLDPLVIDRELDRYRKGSRKLVDLAKHYGVRLDGAHSSDGDALAAARVVWRMARHPKHGPKLQCQTLDEMQDWQARCHQRWAAHFQEYLRTKADPPQPDAVIDPSWPWRPLPVREGATA